METDVVNTKIMYEIVIDTFHTNVRKPFRRMVTPLEEKSKALDSHFVSMGERIMQIFLAEVEVSGTRVSLDLSKLKGNKIPLSLFPCQIVAVQGMNLLGRKMVAQKICEGMTY